MSGRFSAAWFWLAAAVLAADQASKYAVEKYSGHGFIFVLIPGLLNLVHTHNRGVAFGLLADAESSWLTAVLVVFSAGVMVLLVWLLAGEHIPGRGGQAGVALILGGAAGNVMDRVLRQSVVDFIDVHLRGYHWPAFNVADSAIVIGAALVVISLLAERRHPATGKA
jgi:signal peptidase II